MYTIVPQKVAYPKKWVQVGMQLKIISIKRSIRFLSMKKSIRILGRSDPRPHSLADPARVLSPRHVASSRVRRVTVTIRLSAAPATPPAAEVVLPCPGKVRTSGELIMQMSLSLVS